MSSEHTVTIKVVGTADEVALRLEAAASKIRADGDEGLAHRATQGARFFYGINRTTINVEEI